MAALRDDEDDAEEYIHSIIQYALPKHISKVMILENTLTDKSLIALIEAVNTNRIDNNNLLLIPFKRVFAELLQKMV